MIFVTGPMFRGKRAWARTLLNCTEEAFSARAIWDVETMAFGCGDLEALAERLSRYDVVIASELGAGVVPADPGERAEREEAGRLACLLAERADTVVRVFCGLPAVLKGTLP